jgi:hypothetical protein
MVSHPSQIQLYNQKEQLYKLIRIAQNVNGRRAAAGSTSTRNRGEWGQSLLAFPTKIPPYLKFHIYPYNTTL